MIYKAILRNTTERLYKQNEYLKIVSDFYPVGTYIEEISETIDSLLDLSVSMLPWYLRASAISRIKSTFGSVARVVHPKTLTVSEAWGLLNVIKDEIKSCADVLADLRDYLAPPEDREVLDNIVVKLNEIYMGLKEVTG